MTEDLYDQWGEDIDLKTGESLDLREKAGESENLAEQEEGAEGDEEDEEYEDEDDDDFDFDDEDETLGDEEIEFNPYNSDAPLDQKLEKIKLLDDALAEQTLSDLIDTQEANLTPEEETFIKNIADKNNDGKLSKEDKYANAKTVYAKAKKAMAGKGDGEKYHKLIENNYLTKSEKEDCDHFRKVTADFLVLFVQGVKLTDKEQELYKHSYNTGAKYFKLAESRYLKEKKEFGDLINEELEETKEPFHDENLITDDDMEDILKHSKEFRDDFVKEVNKVADKLAEERYCGGSWVLFFEIKNFLISVCQKFLQ